MRGSGGGASKTTAKASAGPFGGNAKGPDLFKTKNFFLRLGPNANNILYKQQNLIPMLGKKIKIMRIPSPGDPGFTYVTQQNLIPFNAAKKKK